MDGCLKEELKKGSLDAVTKVLAGLAENSEQPFLRLDCLSALIWRVPEILLERRKSKKQDDPGQLSKVVRSYCSKVSRLLDEAEAFSVDQMEAILHSIPQISPLFSKYPPILHRLTKAIINIWATWPTDGVRLVALLALHGLCSKYEKLIDLCMHSMYEQYGNCCRTLSAYNLGIAVFLMNGLAEIYMIDPQKGAQQGMRFLRQLAMLLQQATRHPTKESTKQIICWQFISRLRFWTHLVASQLEAKPDSPYKKLLFPLSSLLICLSNFQFTPRYFAFLFHWVLAAVDLSNRAKIIIPIIPVLLKIIDHVARQPLYRMESKKTLYDLAAIYKVSKSEYDSKSYLHLTNWSTNTIFPDLASPVISSLREIMRGTVDRNLKNQLEAHLSKITHQMKQLDELRTRAALTPAQVTAKSNAEIGKDCLSLQHYLENLQKVRNMKRQLLVNKHAEKDEEHEDDEEDEEDEEDSSAEEDSDQEENDDSDNHDKDKKNQKQKPVFDEDTLSQDNDFSLEEDLVEEYNFDDDSDRETINVQQKDSMKRGHLKKETSFKRFPQKRSKTGSKVQSRKPGKSRPNKRNFSRPPRKR